MTATSTTSRMTGRQRVNAMLMRREHDRVPRYDTYWPETIQKWNAQGLEGEAWRVYELLESDLTGLCWCWPVPFPGRRQVLREDENTQDIIDSHGKTLRVWKNKSGIPEQIAFDCDSRDQWEKVYKPALLAAPPVVDIQATQWSFKQARERGLWCCMSGVEAFEQIRALLGEVGAMIAMAEDPDWVRDIAASFTTASLKNYQQIVDAGIKPDGLWLYGDMAFNHATFCSPAMYRDQVWEQHVRFVEWAHGHGMKCILHTDGNVNAIVGDYIEAGFDCLQPLEAKASMDVRELVPRWGDRLSFFGNIDAMVMGRNDRDALEVEVRTKFAAGMTHSGYMYHSDHSVPPEVDWSTYLYLIELINQYGNYA